MWHGGCARLSGGTEGARRLVFKNRALLRVHAIEGELIAEPDMDMAKE